ncbi:MAG: LysR family transcriptional regulator [Treponema sp.]|nr:LysR family transcriptional regulator [Treponema sp.]
MDIELLRERASIIQRVRAFFDQRGYLETDTPLLAPDLIPESCLEVFNTMRLWPEGSRRPAKPYWLIPSPEIWMKRLIARHRTNIYQICKCFRNGESSGDQHSPEFTMLEYYTMEAGYRDSLKLTEELFGFLAGGRDNTVSDDLRPPFIKMTVGEAFERWAGFDLYRAAVSAEAMVKEAGRLGLNPMPGLSVPELYDLIFIHSVEPQIRMNKPVALTDYPAFVPCLARKKPDGKTVERWELYARGTELANCYSEEIGAEQVRSFFESEKTAKEKNALVRHSTDDNYWKMFEPEFSGGSLFPECSGVALGLDRLIMVLAGKKNLDSVLPFPME